MNPAPFCTEEVLCSKKGRLYTRRDGVKTEILKIDANSPEAPKIKKVAESLQRGNIAAIPTETVYGLAGNVEDKIALDRLYAIKKRPKTKPFTIQIANFLQLTDYIDELPPELEIILREFWPGPLTIIINGKNGKVGLRMPDNKVALSIIEEAKVPLAVTSANISGKPSAFSAKEVFEIFDGKIEIVVDDGSVAVGVESTVLDCTVTPFAIVRKGPISEKLEKFLEILK